MTRTSKQQNPTVSIIVPVYNVETYLSECLYSLLFKQGNDLEVIAVDDNSTDNSAKILKEYNKKHQLLSIINQSCNQGVSAARNAGLDAACGKYIMFVDADDKLMAGAVERLTSIVSDNDADIIKFNCRLTNGSGEITSEPKAINQTRYDLTNEKELKTAFCFTVGGLLAWNGFYKRSVIDSLRFVDLPNGEDVLFGTQAFCKARSLLLLPETLYEYRVRPGSAARTMSKKHCLSAIEAAAQMYDAIHATEFYTIVETPLFRKVRGLANGSTLNVLNKVKKEDQHECWDYWFNRFEPIFCTGNLVPKNQQWLYNAVFRTRNKKMVYLYFYFPIKLKSYMLSSNKLKLLWTRIRKLKN